jgi:hypothetical protein
LRAKEIYEKFNLFNLSIVSSFTVEQRQKRQCESFRESLNLFTFPALTLLLGLRHAAAAADAAGSARCCCWLSQTLSVVVIFRRRKEFFSNFSLTIIQFEVHMFG